MSSVSRSRDRHGRGMRRPIPSKLFKHGLTRSSFFEEVVGDTCEYLRNSFTEDLRALNYRIEDVPSRELPESANRWSTRKSTMTIVLYRIPIERSGKQRLTDPRILIEQAVVSAAANLIDRDPWDLLSRGD